MKFVKEGRAKYISHLDLMHTMQRSMARCQMPLWFTEGFNQHAYVSVALPLSTGYSGEWELLDFNLVCDSVPINAVEALNAVFPEGLRAVEIYPLSDGGMPLRDIAWSRYRITWSFADGRCPEGFVDAVTELFQRDTVEILKRSKRAEKQVNMREFMKDLNLVEQDGKVIAEVVTAAGNNNMSPEYLTTAITQYLPQYAIAGSAYHRLCVYNTKMQAFR